MARVHWAAASQPGQAHGLSYPLAQLSDGVQSLGLPPRLAHCPISNLCELRQWLPVSGPGSSSGPLLQGSHTQG